MEAGKIIKNYLADNGIKQNFVAERAGIPHELFRRSLDGKRKITAEEFVAICIVLSLDIDFFKETA